VFFVLIFPLGDLTDLLSRQITHQTGGAVQINIEDMRLGLFPAPAIVLSESSIDIVGMSPLKVKELSLSPSIRSLFSLKPSGSLRARGLWGGEISASFLPGKKSESGTPRNRITLKGDQLKVEDVVSLASLPLPLQGLLNVHFDSLADLSWAEQPEGEIQIDVQNFNLPPASVSTPLGPITLPELRLKGLSLKGRLNGGTLQVDEGRIGAPGDEVVGSLKGTLGLRLQPGRGGPKPQLGSYSFDVDLKIQKGFQSRASFLLALLDPHKKDTPDGAQYRVRISASALGLPPNISTLR
ncbi:MAG: type II secretion system protein GspN, partial [Bdellovibrionaceae bacterium]|nr:type II secretion system protein GspN [Pseudobdellovibrionaceae bacterium]